MLKETWTKWLRERITALRGTRNLAVYLILSRFLRSVRLVLPLARSHISCSFNHLFSHTDASRYPAALRIQSHWMPFSNGMTEAK